MALAFEKARVTITNETGIHEDTITKGFERDIREVEHRPVVEVAIQSFKLDLAGNARPTDVVQVTASIQDVGEETVTVKVRTNYSGGPYSGEVTVLIIADLVDVKVPANS
jgi:hypothetical protein